MRCFIGVPLDVDARVDLRGRADSLDGTGGMRRVSAESLHVTVLFLGDTDGPAERRITDVLDRVGTETEPFAVLMNRWGSFPRRGAARILFADIGAGREGLVRLNRTVVTLLGGKEEEYAPHVTVARAARNGRFAVPGTGEWESPIPFTADRIVLFESYLGHGGAVYAPLHISPFTGRGGV